jgi:hypothetical protein
MRFLAPPHQWFLKLTFLKIELWVYSIARFCSRRLPLALGLAPAPRRLGLWSGWLLASGS